MIPLVFIPPKDFAQVVRNTPLVSIDLILRDPEGAVLLGLRTHEPAKGQWFVPGGRVGKNETLDQAFVRVLKTETGIVKARRDAHLLGFYEHFYDSNRFEEDGYGTHYIVLGYELTLDARPDIVLDAQHSAIRWLPVDALLADAGVHENTKAYFI